MKCTKWNVCGSSCSLGLYVPSLLAQTACTLTPEDKKRIDQLLAKKVKGVCFHKRDNAWLARWYEGVKERSKSFAIGTNGSITNGSIKEAYDKAVAFRKAKEASGVASIQQPAEKQSGHTGVSCRKERKAWVASWYDASGEPQQRCFPVSEYEGDSEAKAAAICCRLTMVEQREREKQDMLVSSRKRPSEAPEGRSVRRKTNK